VVVAAVVFRAARRSFRAAWRFSRAARRSLACSESGCQPSRLAKALPSVGRGYWSPSWWTAIIEPGPIISVEACAVSVFAIFCWYGEK